MSSPILVTPTATAPDVYPKEPGDHDKMSHYVPKDKLTEALVLGTPVQAICGKMWVPTRDGMKFPVCGTCKEIYESLSAE